MVDRNGDGLVSLQEFKATFEDPEVADTLEDVDTEEFNFVPPPITNPTQGWPARDFDVLFLCGCPTECTLPYA